jgi:hypothetical protein
VVNALRCAVVILYIFSNSGNRYSAWIPNLVCLSTVVDYNAKSVSVVLIQQARVEKLGACYGNIHCSDCCKRRE